MSELFTISGYIFAVIIAILYEYQTKNLLRKPKNKVRFYVMTNFVDNRPCLCIKDIDGNYSPIADADHLNRFGINAFEFLGMPIEEVREVFINLED